MRVRSLKAVFRRGWVSFAPSPLKRIAQPALIYYGSYIKPCFSSAQWCFMTTFRAAGAMSLLEGCQQKGEVCGEEGPTRRTVGHHHLLHQFCRDLLGVQVPSLPGDTVHPPGHFLGMGKSSSPGQSHHPCPHTHGRSTTGPGHHPAPSVVPTVLGSHQATLRIELWLLRLVDKQGKAGSGHAWSLLPRDGMIFLLGWSPSSFKTSDRWMWIWIERILQSLLSNYFYDTNSYICFPLSFLFAYYYCCHNALLRNKPTRRKIKEIMSGSL